MVPLSGSVLLGDFTRWVLYKSAIRLCTSSIAFGDFTNVFSIILLSDCVPDRSLLVFSPDVFSIILLSDCTRSISFDDFTRCVLYNSVIRLCTRSITFGDFTRCVLYNSAIRLYQVNIFW